MTPCEEKLIKLFEKYDKESIPGTSQLDALTKFAEDCYDDMPYEPSIAYIYSYISAAYWIGIDRGYKSGRKYEQELKKLEED